MQKSIFGKVVGAGLLLVASTGVQAALVQISGNGTITSVDTTLQTRFVVGSSYSFTSLFDTSATDTNISNTRFGVYPDALLSLNMNWDGYEISASDGDTLVIDQSSGDGFSVAATNTTNDGNIGGLLLNQASIQLIDSSGSIFSNDALSNIETFPHISLFDNVALTTRAQLRFLSGDGATSGLVIGTIEQISATVVPLPAAFWLFGSGVLGLLGIARKKRTLA